MFPVVVSMIEMFFVVSFPSAVATARAKKAALSLENSPSSFSAMEAEDSCFTAINVPFSSGMCSMTVADLIELNIPMKSFSSLSCSITT